VKKRSKTRKWPIIDGIEYRYLLSERRTAEFCVTRAAVERRRRELFERAHGRCERENCRRLLDIDAPFYLPNAMHWSHKKSKGAGGDDSMQNGEALCRNCHSVGVHGQM